MKRYRRILAALLLIGIFASAGWSAAPLKVLVFTKTATAAGWTRHVSIPAGIACIRALGTKNGFTVDTTEDSSYFTAANLSKYGTLIFLNAIGSVFDTNQHAALVSYMSAGGGFIAIHYSISLDTAWSWYGSLNGARSSGSITTTYLNIRENPTHYIVRNMPDTFKRDDEYYTYKVNPRTNVPNITVLYHATVSGTANTPTAWCHPFGGGRAFNTTIGHFDTTYSDTNYRKLLTNAIMWTAGRDSTPSAVRDRSGSGGAKGNLLSLERTAGMPCITIRREGVFTLTVYDINGREIRRSLVGGNRPVAIRGPAGLKIVTVKTKDGLLLGSRKIAE